MLNLSNLIKISPILGGILIVAISFGELTASVHDLQKQCDHMQVQLDQIQNKLSQVNKLF